MNQADQSTAAGDDSAADLSVEDARALDRACNRFEAVVVLLFSLASRLLDPPLETVVLAPILLVGLAGVTLMPGLWTRARTIEGIGGAAGIGLGATVVFLLIDVVLLQHIGTYTNRWYEIGSSNWWYHPVWWMVGTFLPWMGAWILANQLDRNGRVSVPALWDQERRTIVNNESAEIIWMLNGAFDRVGATGPDYCPKALRAEIDALNHRVYEHVNNGVYRAGFARSQEAYDEAVTALFETLDELEERLSRRRYLAGDQVDREVPSGEGGDDANRFRHRLEPAALS